MILHRGPRSVRGNALMLTLIALAVLMVLVGGAIQFTSRNREAATEKIRGERVSGCVDAARRYLLSRLSLTESPTSSLKLFSTKLIDDADPTLRTNMMTGHYEVATDGAPSAKATVTLVDADTMGAAANQAVSVANVFPKSGILGGQYYRVVVKCEEPSANPDLRGRQSEVEFLFRYGI